VDLCGESLKESANAAKTRKDQKTKNLFPSPVLRLFAANQLREGS
jgi:hypothetical protein